MHTDALTSLPSAVPSRPAVSRLGRWLAAGIGALYGPPGLPPHENGTTRMSEDETRTYVALVSAVHF